MGVAVSDLIHLCTPDAGDRGLGGCPTSPHLTPPRATSAFRGLRRRDVRAGGPGSDQSTSRGSGGRRRCARSAGGGVVWGHKGVTSVSAAAGASVRRMRSRSRP